MLELHCPLQAVKGEQHYTTPPRLTPAVPPLLFISETDAGVSCSLFIILVLFNPEGLTTRLCVRPPQPPLKL